MQYDNAFDATNACNSGVSDVLVVSEDGSPHGPKCFVLWNPPLTHPGKKGAQRRSGVPSAPGTAGGITAGLPGSGSSARVRAKISKCEMRSIVAIY